MAHFAELNDSNEVVRVIVVNDEDTTDADGNEKDAIGEAFCADLLGGTWKRTSYNNNYRVRFAAAGDTFNADLDAFIAPSPYPSWVLNESTTEWEPPVGYPTEPGKRWDEETTSWVDVE